MSKKRSASVLDPAIADAAVRRAVSSQTFDAVYETLLGTLAGICDGAQQALASEGITEPSAIGDAVGEAIGGAIRQALDTVRTVGAPDTLACGEVNDVVQARIFAAVRGVVAGALALQHSIAAVKGSKL